MHKYDRTRVGRPVLKTGFEPVFLKKPVLKKPVQTKPVLKKNGFKTGFKPVSKRFF